MVISRVYQSKVLENAPTFSHKACNARQQSVATIVTLVETKKGINKVIKKDTKITEIN